MSAPCFAKLVFLLVTGSLCFQLRIESHVKQESEFAQALEALKKSMKDYTNKTVKEALARISAKSEESKKRSMNDQDGNVKKQKSVARLVPDHIRSQCGLCCSMFFIEFSHIFLSLAFLLYRAKTSLS